MRRLGVLGGMGPLSSARFLLNLYEHHRADPGAGEQSMPQVVLLSDPSVPDRTAAVRGGREQELADRLTCGIEQLVAAGAERVVIACVTVHCALDRVAPELRHRVISLLDLAFDELAAAEGTALMLTTSGTRAAGIFQSHPAWPGLSRRIEWLTEEDQERLQSWVYELKQGAPAAPALRWIEDLAARQGASVLVYGCTELHLLPAGSGRCRIVDPLWCAIRRLPELVSVVPLDAPALT